MRYRYRHVWFTYDLPIASGDFPQQAVDLRVSFKVSCPGMIKSTNSQQPRLCLLFLCGGSLFRSPDPCDAIKGVQKTTAASVGWSFVCWEKPVSARLKGSELTPLKIEFPHVRSEVKMCSPRYQCVFCSLFSDLCKQTSFVTLVTLTEKQWNVHGFP